MADKNGKTYSWPDGSKGHTISYEQHKANMAAEAKAQQGTAHWDPAWLASVQAGQAPPQQAGGTYQPGSPGVPNPTVKPFLTPQQMANDAEKQGQFRQSVIDIDKALSDLETQTTYEQTNLEKSRVQSRDNVQNNTAAAGWSGSSVQDGDLFDIEATARLRREYMNTNLDTAKITAGNKKSAITDEQAAWDKALEQMKVENAAGVSTALGPWQTEPTEGKWVPPSATAAGGAVTGFGLAPQKGNQVPLGGGAAPRPANQSSTREGSTAAAPKKSTSSPRPPARRGGATPY